MQQLLQDMLENIWMDVDYCLDIVRTSYGNHVEPY